MEQLTSMWRAWRMRMSLGRWKRKRQSKQKITVLPQEALEKTPTYVEAEFWKNLSERAGREADEPADVP